MTVGRWLAGKDFLNYAIIIKSKHYLKCINSCGGSSDIFGDRRERGTKFARQESDFRKQMFALVHR